MNNERRKRLTKVIELVDDARVLLEEIISDEQDSFDNMPESLQESERGEQMEEYISIMEELLDSLDVEGLEDIVNKNV